MARTKKTETTQKPIEQYEHKDKERLNNPPVGLVTVHNDNGGLKKKKYQYDPHIDPQLQWAGKAEHTSFEVPTVSLHVHERIDPRRIIETVRKQEKSYQPSLFEEHHLPLREAIEFYKHKENWTNRLIAGDSLLVMNSLLEKESMGGKAQMVYFDPPYGIKYSSNFQPFIDKRDVKDKDEDLTSEPEMIKAFRDTWELGIHSYLTYLRDRLLLSRELLHESGSIFVQMSDENVHYVRAIMDEVFGIENFISQISFRKKTMPLGTKTLEQMHDFLLWYAKDYNKLKYHKLWKEYNIVESQDWDWIQLADGTRRKMTNEEKSNNTLIPTDAKIYRLKHPSPIGYNEQNRYEYEFEGKKYSPPINGWGIDKDKMDYLVSIGRVQPKGNLLNFILFFDDFPVTILTNPWTDTVGPQNKKYVVQTSDLPIQRCLLMTTDPGDLVLDITCGSGTTAYVSEQWGRRWITCDTSRVSIAIAKQRLMTATYDYYELAQPNEGVGSGFRYKTVPHITIKSIVNNEPSPKETLYDQPYIDNRRLRVTGPFTVEAVPAPIAKSLEDYENDTTQEGDLSITRKGETLRQNEWRDELLRSGVRAKGGKLIEFTRVEPLSGTRYLQAEAETKIELPNKDLFNKEAQINIDNLPKRVLICFGPEHAPLEQRIVELTLEEAMHLKPKPDMILFCAFQFDEEAAKDIDEINWPGVTLLKAQMNADLFTDDLKKNRSSNESFWLIGQPDIFFEEIKTGNDKRKYRVEIRGFDYYNPKTGTVESGGKGDIAMWMLDHDYDGRSLFPSQVFFPMAGAKEGWDTLAKNLKAQIDEEKIEAFGGTVSLPFTPGKAVAVKIIDARGIESLKIIRM
ncbi:MAG: site-specific DNA-methyltransferase [Bacillota bacterium]